jgi:hypothetical protein
MEEFREFCRDKIILQLIENYAKDEGKEYSVNNSCPT